MSSPPLTGSRGKTAARPKNGYASVLAVVSDSAHRLAVVQACRAAGVKVVAVTRLAELERWPRGQMVITDFTHLTPWWRTVGAREVIVLAQDAEEGMAALENGATGWLHVPTTPVALTAMIARLAAEFG